MNKTVDIIIPVYNTSADLLEHCFLSAINQTWKNIKIIVVNDGSKRQETLDIIEKYSKKPNIKIIYQENAGVSAARNTGLDYSNGDYVFFLDSDDFIDENYIKRMLDVLQVQQVKLVFSGRVTIPGEINDAPFRDHRIEVKKDANIIIIKSHAFTCSAVLIDGKLARSERFTTTTTTMGEDTEYIVKLMTKSTSFFDGQGGCYYVQNPESITHNVKKDCIQRYLDESILLKDIFKKYLDVSDEIVNIYLYLKLDRAYKKLSLHYDIEEIREVAKTYIAKNGLADINIPAIMKTPMLRCGEKIRIILLTGRKYRTVYLINRFMFFLKGKKWKIKKY